MASKKTECLYSMKVRVLTRLQLSSILPWNGIPVRAEGTFAGFMRDRDGTDTLALRVCENDHLMSLFDPRVISVGYDSITFAGFECVDGVWMKQEWNCRILSLRHDPYIPLHFGPQRMPHHEQSAHPG